MPGGGHPRSHRRGGRKPRGDVRSALLLLLHDGPMHGYQAMTAIAERSGGRWTPSPGAIYPAINQLEDEGLITVTAQDGRRVATLTEEGRQAVESGTTRTDPFADYDHHRPGHDLRDLLMQLHDPTRQIGRAGDEAQITAAASILAETRRSLYLLLAGDPAPET